MRVRYTGAAPTTFVALGREAQPDEEFPVPDEEADGYLARRDIEQVPEPAAAKPKAKPVRASAQPDSPTSLDGPAPAPQAPDDTVTD